MGKSPVAHLGLIHLGRGELCKLYLGVSAQVSLLFQFCFLDSMVLFPGTQGTCTVAGTHFFFFFEFQKLYLLDLNDPKFFLLILMSENN